MMFFPVYLFTQWVATAELSRCCRVIRFRLGAARLFFMRAMEMMILWARFTTRFNTRPNRPR